jgi:ribosomal-protein-alanine N-acetyltransferase
LETRRLVLRNYRLEDWERVHLYAARPEFSKYEAWGPNSVEDSKKFVGDSVAQAARALMDYGFNVLKLAVIYATCDVRNAASAKVMEKLGLHRVGLLKGDRMQKGQLRDTLRFEVLKG